MRHSKKKVLSVFLALVIALSVAIIIPKQDTKADIQEAAKNSEIITGDKVKELMLKKFSRAELSNFSQDKYKNQLEKRYPDFIKELKKAEGKNNPKEEVRLIIELQSAAAVAKAPIKDGQGKENYSKVQAEVNTVKSNQSSIINKIEQITGNKVKRSYGYLLNGFSITAKREDIAKIQKVQGVARVTEARMGHFDMNFAKELTQVYQVWEELNYKGEGMVIAVIDSGIDHTHKDLVLGESGKQAAKLKDTNPQGPGKYFTEKIPYGYNFADYNTEIIDKNPFTYMHGMHVAGIIAGNADKNSADTFKGVQGVAPEAQLLAMKVGSNKQDDMGGIFEDDVIAAIEDSVIHGADVINMSLGWSRGFQDTEGPQQIAIKNATDQGVLVVVAAGNEGTSTSDFNGSSTIYNMLDLVDTATIAAPSTAKDALSVASYENSKYVDIGGGVQDGTKDMSGFTSWGPTPNLGFKPEITAPGGNIYSLANENSYQTMSGTSMATPHVAGAQALVIQSIKAKNPNLKGRELVEFAKNIVINTAAVQLDSNNNNLPYSPRRQGSGMIQIKNAINNEVLVTDNKGNAAIELKEIGQTAEVTLNLKNIGNTAATYTLDKSYLMSEKTDPQSKVVKSIKIEGGSVALSQNSITVPANGQATVKMTIKLPNNFVKQQFVEGFVQLKSQDRPTLTVPFIGFYGNWSEMDIIDKPAWQESSKSAWFANLFFNEYMYGVSNPQSRAHIGTTLFGLSEYGSINKLGIYGMDEDDILSIDPSKIAFSPNGDGVNDLVAPNLYFLRNAKELKVDVLNARKEVVATVGRESNINKSLLEEELYNIFFEGNSGTVMRDCAWNGSLYDWSSGKSTTAPQGQYYIRVTAKADMENAKDQVIEMPVLMDTEAPVMELKSAKVVENGKYKLQWSSKDNLSGLDDQIIYVVVNNIWQDVVVKKNGDNYSCDIELEENSVNDILVYNIDFAGNISELNTEVQVGKIDAVYLDEKLNDGQWITSDRLNLKGRVTAEVKSLKINDKEISITESNGFRRFEENLSLKLGDNTIKITAQDNGGKVIFDKSYVIKSDGEVPSLEITEPKIEVVGIAQGYISGFVYLDSNAESVTIKGTATDNFKLREVNINDNSVNLKDDGSFEYKLEIFGNTYCLIQAIDEAGNTSINEIFFITEDDTITAPYVTFYNLYSMTVVNKENSEYDGYVVRGVIREPLKVFTINGKDVPVDDDLSINYLVPLKHGLNVLQVYAENQAGEVVFDAGYKVLYDVNAPSFSITEPVIKRDGKVYTNKDKLTIKGEVSDNTFGYTFYINGDKIVVNNRYPLIGNEANKKEFTHEVAVKGNGKLTFVADDGLGNSMEAVIDVIQDKVAPGAPVFIYDNKPTDKAVMVEIKPNANDNDIETIEFSFDKEKWFVYTGPVKVDGNCKLYARVTDYAGNVTNGEVNITNINKNGNKTPDGADKKDDGKAVDENGNPLPKTGSPINFTVLAIAGAVLIAAGGAFVFFGKKRKKSSDK